MSHPELLQQAVRFAPVDTHARHGLAHRTARLVPDARAPRVNAGTPGANAHGSVHGARARARRGARVVHLADAVDEAVVVDAPLPAVVPELVVQFGFGGVLRRRHAPQEQDERGKRALPVAHGDRSD